MKFSEYYNKERHFLQDIYFINQSTENLALIKCMSVGVAYPSKEYKPRYFISENICIEYVESGSGIVRCGNKFFRPSARDTFILPKGQPTYYWSNVENPWKKYWINVEGKLLDKLCEAYEIKNIVHYHNLDINSEIHRLIDLEKCQHDCTASLIEIINDIFFKMYSHTLKEEPNNLATKVLNYISEHIAEPFSTKEMESIFGKSRYQIYRVFKEQYGINPYTYYLNKKISLAKELLVSSSLPISDIACTLSFYDEYHFSKCFKQKEGISPSAYRKGKNL